MEPFPETAAFGGQTALPHWVDQEGLGDSFWSQMVLEVAFEGVSSVSNHP